MIKVFFDLVDLLRTAAPLLTSVAFFALFGVALAKSIKRHPKVYYTIMAIPFVLFALPFVLRWFDVDMFSFNSIPVLGEIMRDYIHMGSLGHPLLVIIMYMGALDMKRPFVKRLMSIRKELSIMSGFPILTHCLVRATSNFPNALKFFTNNEEYMATSRVANELGAGISNFSYVLGIVMAALFIPLWITSFDSVHRRMGGKRWKKLQKWSYVLYATLFIHAMGIQVGGMLNPRGGAAPKPASTEATVAEAHPRVGARENAPPATDGEQGAGENAGQSGGRHDGRGEEVKPENVVPQGRADRTREGHSEEKPAIGDAPGDPKEERGGKNATPAAERQGSRDESATPAAERQGSRGENATPTAERQGGNAQPQARAAGGGGHTRAKGFADVKVSSDVKRYIHIASLLLIYASYLILRLRKARKNATKKAKAGAAKADRSDRHT